MRRVPDEVLQQLANEEIIYADIQDGYLEGRSPALPNLRNVSKTLMKYMAHVRETTGSDHVLDDARAQSGTDFSDAEWDALRQIALSLE